MRRIALGEQYCSSELIESKAGLRFYCVTNRGLTRRHSATIIKPSQDALFVLKPPIRPPAGSTGFPTDAVARAILSNKIHFGISAAGTTA